MVCCFPRGQNKQTVCRSISVAQLQTYDLWRRWALGSQENSGKQNYGSSACEMLTAGQSAALPHPKRARRQTLKPCPLWFFANSSFSFLPFLIRERLRMCITVFGIHWSYCSLSFYCKTASSWWKLALLISIYDLLDTGSLIIQGKSGWETTVWYPANRSLSRWDFCKSTFQRIRTPIKQCSLDSSSYLITPCSFWKNKLVSVCVAG